jgi:hypothetical protein
MAYGVGRAALEPWTAVHVDDDEAHPVTELRIERYQPFRLTVGVPAVRRPEENNHRTTVTNLSVAQMIALDGEAGAGVVSKAQARPEREIVRQHPYYVPVDVVIF